MYIYIYIHTWISVSPKSLLRLSWTCCVTGDGNKSETFTRRKPWVEVWDSVRHDPPVSPRINVVDCQNGFAMEIKVKPQSHEPPCWHALLKQGGHGGRTLVSCMWGIWCRYCFVFPFHFNFHPRKQKWTLSCHAALSFFIERLNIPRGGRGGVGALPFPSHRGVQGGAATPDS